MFCTKVSVTNYRFLKEIYLLEIELLSPTLLHIFHEFISPISLNFRHITKGRSYISPYVYLARSRFQCIMLKLLYGGFNKQESGHAQQIAQC